MVKINLLIGDPSNVNTRGLYHPLIGNRELLGDSGISVRVFTKINSRLWECDAIGVDSKYFRDSWVLSEQTTLRQLSEIKEKGPALIWFNTADSTGSVQAQVMPFVDLYCKAQILKDKALYQKPLYGGRLYTEFFHQAHNISDSQELVSMTVSPRDIEKKLRLFWNYGLAEGYARDGWLEKVRKRFYVKCSSIAPKNKYHSPGGCRPNSVFLRMQTEYSRNTISVQRKRTVDSLRDFGASADRVSKQEYFREMVRSKVVVSPFGWGEINIRDFECFALGSLLVKPSMAHLETYPKFFVEHETYVPYRWDCSDLHEKIDEITQNYPRYLCIARAAQQRFKSALETRESKEEFVQQVHRIVHEALSNAESGR